MVMNKSGSHRDPCSKIINNKQGYARYPRSSVFSNKRGQFFILAAIIIISAIIGLTVVKNYVTISQIPTNVDRYSQEFGFESGAIVDYILYNGTSGSYLGSFYDESISSSLVTKYPDMEVYVCYGNKTILNCENWGKQDITISVNNTLYSLQGGRKDVPGKIGADGSSTGSSTWLLNSPTYVGLTRKSFSSAGVTSIIIRASDLNYTLDLTKAVQSNQFYLVFKQNSSAGTVISDTSTTPSVSFAPPQPEEEINAETSSK